MFFKYEIDRKDDSFLKEVKDVSSFDFNSKEFQDAVDRSAAELKTQEMKRIKLLLNDYQ